MKCPQCESDNPQGAKFCGKCGAKLSRVCPQCGSENDPVNNFCNKCGHNLTPPQEPIPKELSFNEKLDKIQRYLPKGLTQKILAERDRIEGERKQVTVMFCDMEGFVLLSEKFGPEEAYNIMDQIYEILIHKVHDYEGTVNEMTGDGIMALFGAPIALEDAPQRAIRSGYAIHREMARFNDRIKQERGGIPPLRMRIGIHTGPVVVGTLGNDLRVDFKAVGDTVNLASRMEGLAEPGTTYVTEETFRLTEGFFRFEALGAKEIKGKEEPVKTYRVIAPSTRRTRFDVSAERGLTPFMGRERELELLFDSLERAKASLGQAISIVSEAGIGKSRLLYEFRKAVTSADVMFLEGRCLSYSRGVAYHPVIDSLKANFDIREGDRDSEIKKKVKRGLKILRADEASTLPYLLELFSVKGSGIEKIPLSPEAKKERIIEAINRITLKGSEIRPLILAYEDLHWSDKSSEEVFKYALESIPGARVLMIFTYRPEFVHTWGGRSYHSQVTLNRLSNRESLAMVSHLLGTEEIDRDLEDLILEKTEGIPFFIEEFIRSLKELEIIERRDSRYCLAKDIQDLTIPSTIQDVIMARVDALPDGAKEVLQTGSAIEREFSYELIKQVTGLPEKDLLSNLSALKESELLYERGIYPQSTYIFKHALTREVVYDSILAKRKRKLHDEICNAIEKLYKENIDEHFGVLAEHYIVSENYEKGAEYSKLAAKKARKGALFNDAIAYGEKCATCLAKLPRTEDVEKKLIDAKVTLGLYYNQLFHHVEAKEAVEPIIELALQRDYKRRISQIYTIIGTYSFMIEGDYPKALQHLEEALAIAEELEDRLSLFLASHWIGHALAESCEFERALHHIEKALEINVAANVPWGIAAVQGCISMTVYNNQGRADLGFQLSQENLRFAEERGDTWSKAEAYTYHGCSCYLKGFLDEAKERLLKAITFCERTNFLSLGSLAGFFLGETYFDRREYEKSQDYHGKAISLLEQCRVWPSITGSNKMALARARVMNNEKDVDLEAVYKYADENKMKLYDGMMARCISEMLFHIDDQRMSEAEDWIIKAIETDKRNGTIWNLGRDYAHYAELLKRKGSHLSAKENTGRAMEIFKECGADGWLKKAEEELASLS
ncbi:MAG: AAA family ATPase [Proteobacteria bacterium]|nr:AAA family ATPase [Pseudomonadota bacterium]